MSFVNRIAVFVRFAGVDKCEIFAVRILDSCFDLCVNRAAVKDILLCFHLRTCRVGVVRHRAPIGVHGVRCRTERHLISLVLFTLDPSRVERIFVRHRHVERGRRERVDRKRHVNFLLAAELCAYREFDVERIASGIAVSVERDFVGRKFVHAVVVRVVIGFARLDERSFNLKRTADAQSLCDFVAACVFDVNLITVAERFCRYRRVLILIEGHFADHGIEHEGLDDDSDIDFLCKLADISFALADKSDFVCRCEILCHRREDAESFAADFCLDSDVNALVEVDFSILLNRIDCLCKFGGIPLDVVARHRAFGDKLAVDVLEGVEICNEILRACVDGHRVDFKDRRVIAVAVALALEGHLRCGRIFGRAHRGKS